MAVVPQLIIRTQNDLGALIARVAIGGVMLPHGCQKALGLFGGQGLEATMKMFTENMHVPAPFAALAIAAEFLGAIGLIVGLLGRIAAIGILSVMGVAIMTVHQQNGFFMNWFGNQKGEGFEYHLLAIGLALVVLVKGSGACSIDRALTKE